MMIASPRAWTIFVLLTCWLVGCATGGPVREPASDMLPTALPPAELPTYAENDRYTLNNPDETWRVVDIAMDLISWENGQGDRMVTMFDPLLPPIRWTRADGGGAREILRWNGALFPLAAGNKLTFKTAVSVTGQSGHARFIWNCHVNHPRQVTVPAGEFAAYPVFCRRSDGRETQVFYAPALLHPVAITVTTGEGKPVSRQLVGFQQGHGPRATASKRKGLPAGWAVAAVAGKGEKQPAGPRILPGDLAAADPPLGFASPSEKAAATDDGERPGRSAPIRTTKRIPAQKSPRGAAGSGFGAHIGSFRSKRRAEQGWSLFGSRYGAILTDQPHFVVPVDLGESKGRLYRLIVGPLKSAAQGGALCGRIQNQGGYCRVVDVPAG